MVTDQRDVGGAIVWLISLFVLADGDFALLIW